MSKSKAKKKAKESSSEEIYIAAEFSDLKVNVLSNKNYALIKGCSGKSEEHPLTDEKLQQKD